MSPYPFFFLVVFLVCRLLPLVSSATVMCKGQLCENDCDHCNLCNPTSCPLSKNGSTCYCASTSIPGGLAIQYTPQFVFLSFQGGLKESFINQTNFTTNFLGDQTTVDSIGAQVKPSLYITTDELDYNVANWFQQVGTLGFQSVTNKVTPKTTNIQLNAEFTQGLLFLQEYGMITPSSINKARNPSMQLADNWYTALKGRNFTIDSSVSDNPYDWNSTQRVWPYTLDFGIHNQVYCKDNCPTTTYPGMWEFVVPTLYDANNISVTLNQLSMDNYAASMAVLKQNFYDTYLSNRAPFGLVIDKDWLYMNADNVSMIKFAFLKEFYVWMGTLDNVVFATEDEIISWMVNPSTYINSKPIFLGNMRTQIPLSHACGGITPTFCDYPNDRSSLLMCVLPDPILGNVTCPAEYPNIRNQSCGDGMCVIGLDECNCTDCGAVCRPNWPGAIYFEPYAETDTIICGSIIFNNPMTDAAMNFIISARIYWGSLAQVIGAQSVDFENITLGCITENWRIKPYLMSAFYPLTNYSTIQICINKTQPGFFDDTFVQLGIEIIQPLLGYNDTMIGYKALCGDGICSAAEHGLCNSDCFIPFSALGSTRLQMAIVILTIVFFAVIGI